MQVKDYLQALSDDNKIRVEKIGSGNWYWSFPSDEKIAKEAALEKAQEDYNKAAAVVADLQSKVDEAGAAREEDGEALKASGMTRSIQYSYPYSYASRQRPKDSHRPACRLDQGVGRPAQGRRRLQ
jgi:hypothetical protein